MEVLHEEITPFNHLVVAQEGGERLLFSPPEKLQGRMVPANPDRVVLASARIALTGLLFGPDPGEVLVVGLGAGVFPRAVKAVFPDARVTVVEIDEKVAEVAERFFGFDPEAHGRVVIADGGRFAGETGETFDLVYLDAYLGYDLPEPMTDPGFFKALGGRLREGGLLLMNLIPGRLGRKRAVKVLLKTFPEVAVLEVPEMENLILAAGRGLEGCDLEARHAGISGRLPPGTILPGGLERIKIYSKRR